MSGNYYSSFLGWMFPLTRGKKQKKEHLLLDICWVFVLYLFSFPFFGSLPFFGFHSTGFSSFHTRVCLVRVQVSIHTCQTKSWTFQENKLVWTKRTNPPRSGASPLPRPPVRKGPKSRSVSLGGGTEASMGCCLQTDTTLLFISDEKQQEVHNRPLLSPIWVRWKWKDTIHFNVISHILNSSSSSVLTGVRCETKRCLQMILWFDEQDGRTDR